jgi:hypothetical protein
LVIETLAQLGRLEGDRREAVAVGVGERRAHHLRRQAVPSCLRDGRHEGDAAVLAVVQRERDRGGRAVQVGSVAAQRALF